MISAMTSTFYCKKFSVIQQERVFKVNTDGLLLGAWINIGSQQRILDTGTGTGIIALAIAQRTQAFNTTILGIDILEDSVRLARYNFNNSTWKERITSKHISLQELASDAVHKHEFDHVVINPPFFKRSKLSPKPYKNIQRHEIALTLEDILECSLRLLNVEGVLSFIYPFHDYEKARTTICNSAFFIVRECIVHSREQKPVRMLVSLSKRNLPLFTDHIVMYDESGDYHPDYKNLLRDFLTIF